MKSALKLISHVWSHNRTSAWAALNQCMYDAVQLAIGSKLDWQASDFKFIEANFRPGYWLGEHGWERPYALAVWTEGTSFIKAYESFAGRKPFLANAVSAQGRAQGYAHAHSQNRCRGRIALSSEVWIGDERFQCTSISNARVVLVSRSSKGKRTIRKLTHEDCAVLWPAPKKKKPAAEVSEVAA